MPKDFDQARTRWTMSAIECFNLNGDCSRCYMQDLISEPCQMKETVQELLKVQGLPPIYLCPEGYTEEEFYSEVKAMLLMKYTHKEIAERFNVPFTKMRGYIQKNNLFQNQIGIKQK